MSTAASGRAPLRSMFAKVYEDVTDKPLTSQTSFECCSSGVGNGVQGLTGPSDVDVLRRP